MDEAAPAGPPAAEAPVARGPVAENTVAETPAVDNTAVDNTPVDNTAADIPAVGTLEAETRADYASVAPTPGPESAPRNEWSDWYSATEPQTAFQPPASPPLAKQPLASQPPAPPAYQPPPPQWQPPPQPQPVQWQPPPPPPPESQRQPSPQPQLPSEPQPPYPGADGGGDRRSRAPLFWSVLSAALAIAVVATVLLLHPFSHNETLANTGNTANAANATTTARPIASATAGPPSASASAPASASPAASVSASVSPTAVTEQQAASTMAGMLASSVTDRTAINDAYNDVDRCGPNLHGDAAVFTRAVASRRALLTSLATMPGRAALPPALLTDLTKAWQASMAADQGFATWANDEVSQGCVAGDTSDPGYQTTITPDNEATEYKTDFAAAWNPIATRYDLTTYQQGQL